MRIPSRALAVGLVALTAAGCETLPHFLADSRDKIVAVDVALEPDSTLSARTSAGSSHITLVRRFVRESDLHHLAAVVAHVMSETPLDQLNLKTMGYRSGTWNGVAGTALAIDASPELRRLQERIVEETRMFGLDPATAKQFITTPDGAKMSDKTITLVDRFVPNESGVYYQPHVSVGAAAATAGGQTAESITFKPVGASVYQLGNTGASERLLWTWTGEPGAR